MCRAAGLCLLPSSLCVGVDLSTAVSPPTVLCQLPPPCTLLHCSAGCRGGSIGLQQDGPLTAQGGFKLRMERHWQGRQQQEKQQRAASGEASYPTATELFHQPDRGAAASSSKARLGDRGGMPSVTHFVPPGLVCLEMPVGGSSRVSMLFYAVPVR